jgi:maltose/maltodextrin transport system permease protein
MARAWPPVAKWLIGAVLGVVVLYLAWFVAAAGQPVLALCLLVGFGLALYTYLAGRAYTWRYLLPGLAGMLIFVILPVAYTVRLGFTNYSSRNILTLARATQYLLDQTVAGPGKRYEFALHADGGGHRLVLTPVAEETPEPEGAADDAEADDTATEAPSPPPKPVLPFVTERLDLAGGKPEVDATLMPAGLKLGEPLELKDVIQLRPALARLKVRLPDRTEVSLASLREFAPLQPAYLRQPDGTLRHTQTGEVLTPNLQTGFFETRTGEQVRPGFKVDVGLANYVRAVTDKALTGPLIRIFWWTITFALLTVVFTVIVGVTLAVVLNWEALQGRVIYRTLLFLPYAVPGFISILVFRGLFNQNFGELNLILSHLFGIKPAWFSDPFLAKTMLLIVNTWLGYPYILVLATGLIKAIPGDLYEASAMAGAGPLQNFRHVTAPLIIRPLTPLLISSFAFNFNNFVLISLLTQGRPDFIDARIPAGTTDILVSYTYRIAFQDSGQQFGLAAAISTVIFVIVAGLSIINLRLTRGRVEGQPR